jgi:Tfp pilus assembly protein PilO
MNRNVTALILIVLGIGIYFTFTQAKIDELKAIQAVNDQYTKAMTNANNLIKIRDRLLKDFNAIKPVDIGYKLNKLLPDNVDNVRLIIDVKDDIARNHGLVLKNIKTDSPDSQKKDARTNQETQINTPEQIQQPTEKYGTVTMSFSVLSSYQTFIDFLKDLESSLRLIDISKITISKSDTPNVYEFGVEIKTYWLK